MESKKKAVFKKLRYRSIHFDPSYGEFVYAFLGKKCVFSGITKNATSTINVAEEIVEAIINKEGLHPFSKTFYDLQTHRRYQKKPGEFEFDRFKLKIREKRVRDVTWSREKCPQETLDTFHDFVWH